MKKLTKMCWISVILSIQRRICDDGVVNQLSFHLRSFSDFTVPINDVGFPFQSFTIYKIPAEPFQYELLYRSKYIVDTRLANLFF